jgi:CHRD domain
MPNGEQICYRITVSNIRPATAAHIHKGAFDERGPIVRELEAPSDSSSRGCVTLSHTKIMNIKNNPSGYYVNVHNKPFPDGAVRGQLSTSP